MVRAPAGGDSPDWIDASNDLGDESDWYDATYGYDRYGYDLDSDFYEDATGLSEDQVTFHTRDVFENENVYVDTSTYHYYTDDWYDEEGDFEDWWESTGPAERKNIARRLPISGWHTRGSTILKSRVCVMEPGGLVHHGSELREEEDMLDAIDRLIGDYESGRVSRRELAKALAGLLAGASAAANPSSGTFQAVGLNHVALRVTDIPRSRDFYVRHLGLEVSQESSSSCFLSVGDQFVALFRSSEPRMDHYCYAVADYDVDAAAEKLRQEGLTPRVRSGRIYFDDPDGLEVQLAAKGHGV